MNSLKHIKIILLLMLSISSISCSCDDDDDDTSYLDCIQAVPSPKQSDQEYIEYHNTSNSWKCLNIEHYKISYILENQICFGTEYIIEVQNGLIIDSVSIIGEFAEELFCDVTTTRNELFTVDKLFEVIEEALDDNVLIEFVFLGEELFRAERVNIQYESELSYPKSISIDYVLGLSDEELEITITNFEVIK